VLRGWGFDLVEVEEGQPRPHECVVHLLWGWGWGLWFRVWGLGFVVWGLGVWVKGLRFKVDQVDVGAES